MATLLIYACGKCGRKSKRYIACPYSETFLICARFIKTTHCLN